MSFLDSDIQNLIKECTFAEYVRKSSKDNEDKQMRSLEGQEEDLNEVIKEYNLKIYGGKPFRESRSAFETGRPDFNHIVELIEKGIINAVLVWHTNRIARNYLDGGKFVQLMSDDKLKLVLTPWGCFRNNPRDKEYLMTEFTRATRDSDDKSEAVIRGNRTKLKIGYIPSGRLNEWLIHIKNTKGEYINDNDPVHFPLLKKAIRLILTGEKTPKEALHILNHEWKFRTRKTRRMGGNPLAESTWYKMLSDPTSYGDFSKRKNIQTGQRASFQTLMTEEEFDMIQVLLGKGKNRRRTKNDWPYNQVMTCGECGSAILTDEKWQIICPACKTKFAQAKGREKCIGCGLAIKDMKNPTILHYEWVRCCKSKLKADGNRCTQKSIKIINFKEQIDQKLDDIWIPESFTKWAISILRKRNGEEVFERTVIHKNLQEIYNDTQKQIDNLLDLRIRGLIDDGEYNQKKNVLLLEKQEINNKLQGNDERANKWLELSERTFNFCTYARYWFANGTNEQKRSILRALDLNLTIKDEKVQIHLPKPLLAIKEFKELEAKIILSLEPTKSTEDMEQSGAFLPVTKSLLRDLDSNQDT